MMTICELSIGNAGMASSVDELSSQRDARPQGSETHAPRLVPAEETDDGPRQVPDFSPCEAGITVAGTAPDSHRLPFEPPPVRLASVGGTLIGPAATSALDGLSNEVIERP